MRVCVYPAVSPSFLLYPGSSAQGTNEDSCDIEQEVNGLFSIDRKEKMPAADVKAVIDGAMKHYHEYVAPKPAS